MAYTNAVIDLSHYNAQINLACARQGGIAAVIHKATQGCQFTDPTYKSNLVQAQSLGLLWGAYHFATGEDAVSQANFFLQTVQPAAGILLALDFESNTPGTTMTLQGAREFVTRIQAVTGIWPGLYGGSYLKEQLGSQPDPVLQNCWLWLAEYAPTAVLPPGWSNWTLWQYTDGHIVPDPDPIAGCTPCDRSYFCDTPAALQSKWATGSLA
jgi:lysozyme